MYNLPECAQDLIDTLWNVKFESQNTGTAEQPDLIDTLWNVKTTEYTVPQINVPRFNRYIVECKGFE